MVEIGAIGSIWYQIGQIFFMSTAFFGSPVAIRACIVAGNFIFVLNAALGWPFWPNLSRKPYVLAIDTILWEGVIGTFNLVKLFFEVRKYYKDKREGRLEHRENEIMKFVHDVQNFLKDKKTKIARRLSGADRTNRVETDNTNSITGNQVEID